MAPEKSAGRPSVGNDLDTMLTGLDFRSNRSSTRLLPVVLGSWMRGLNDAVRLRSPDFSGDIWYRNRIALFPLTGAASSGPAR